ncbi:MAG TPA: toll/interleukin-1 receptor domain-containing protein [Ktedonobacteraceae bacterium]|jgi:hypothetical protein
MITLFVVHTAQDATYAEQLRTALEARGYHVWREPSSSSPADALDPHTIEQAISNSAATVLLWSSAAAQSEDVKQHILLAQQFKKQVIPVLLDETALPVVLVAGSPIIGQGDCTQIAAQVASQLPLVSNMDESSPPPSIHADDAGSLFGVRCKNGHVSYFDKHVVCKASIRLPRILEKQVSKALDELFLTCSTCGIEVIAHVDCGGYR